MFSAAFMKEAKQGLNYRSGVRTTRLYILNYRTLRSYFNSSFSHSSSQNQYSHSDSTLSCLASFFFLSINMSDSYHPTNAKEMRIEKEEEEGMKLEFSEDEEALVVRMFCLVGERWSLIAGRIPGRSAKEIEKYWTSKCTSSSSET